MSVASVAARRPVTHPVSQSTPAGSQQRISAAPIDSFESARVSDLDPSSLQALTWNGEEITLEKAKELAQKLLEKGEYLMEMGAKALPYIRKYLPLAEKLAPLIKPFLPGAVNTGIDYVLAGLRAIVDAADEMENNPVKA